MNLSMESHNCSGKLITFCGLDGCGKTTMIMLLKQMLEHMGLDTALTKQPSNFIREWQLFRAYQDQSASDCVDYRYRAVSLMCAADRIMHTEQVVKPWLEQGKTVICDRYFYSCLANLRARGFSEDRWIFDISKHIIKPDLSVFLDVDVNTAISRVRKRPAEKDSFIDMPLQFALRKQYLEIAHENGGIVIDSSESIEKTFSEIRSAVLEILKIKQGGKKNDRNHELYIS